MRERFLSIKSYRQLQFDTRIDLLGKLQKLTINQFGSMLGAVTFQARAAAVSVLSAVEPSFLFSSLSDLLSLLVPPASRSHPPFSECTARFCKLQKSTVYKCHRIVQVVACSDQIHVAL